MKCLICKMGETYSGEVTLTLQRGESILMVKNVPARVCENCGDFYLSDDVSAQVLAQAESAATSSSQVKILRFAA